MRWLVYRASDTRSENGPPCPSAVLDKQVETDWDSVERFYVIDGDDSTPVKVSREVDVRVIVNPKGRDWVSSAEGCEEYENMPCITIYDGYVE